jgi:hypothetical protein
MFGLAQLVMGKAQVIGTSHQIHPGFQRLQTTGGVTAFAGQDGQPFTERTVDALNESRIPHGSSLRSLQQFVGLALLPIGQDTRDFYHLFLLGALDYRDNAQILPHL